MMVDVVVVVVVVVMPPEKMYFALTVTSSSESLEAEKTRLASLPGNSLISDKNKVQDIVFAFLVS